MKRSILILAALAALAPSASASGVWHLQGAEYKVDTLQHYRVGPGTTLTVVDLSGPAKQRVWYSTTDLTAPGVAIKNVNGANIRTSRKTVPNLAAQAKGDGNIYFLGVNSDLFSTLGPLGTTIENGEIVKTAKESTAWKAVAQEKDGSMYYGAAALGFGASLNGGRTYAPTLVNVPRYKGESAAILYTSRWGTTTRTNSILDQSAGKWIDNTDEQLEVVLRPKNGKLNSVGATECTVVSAPVKGKTGNTAIPSGCMVLSTNNSAHFSRLGAMKAGDTYTLTPSGTSLTGVGFGNSHSFAEVTEMAGGSDILVANGEAQASFPNMPNNTSRRPRTALGTDVSRTKMYMLVVDGDSYNKGISAGVNGKDLADMMLAIGCHDAINFDGGGSSIMYTSIDGTLNRPSDGNDRAVSSAIFLTTADKGDKTVASIEFADPHKTLAKGAKYTPVFYGYNQAGLLVDKNVKGVTLIAPDGLGTVSADGRTLTVTGDGTFRLRAKSGAMGCNIAVRAGDWESASGIDGVEVSDNDAPVEYFDLQGRPVADPAPGVYIRRQGSKTEKVIIR